MDMNEKRKMIDIASEVIDELEKATKMFGKFRVPHEGFAVILEEVDELWDAVKIKSRGFKEQRKECIQIAAMAIRFILDLDQKEQKDGKI